MYLEHVLSKVSHVSHAHHLLVDECVAHSGRDSGSPLIIHARSRLILTPSLMTAILLMIGCVETNPGMETANSRSKTREDGTSSEIVLAPTINLQESEQVMSLHYLDLSLTRLLGVSTMYKKYNHPKDWAHSAHSSQCVDCQSNTGRDHCERVHDSRGLYRLLKLHGTGAT